jgi:hypothetical protein
MASDSKIALFIDGANLYATAKALGFDIDYRRLLKEFRSRGVLLRAYCYAAIIEDQEYTSIRPLPKRQTLPATVDGASACRVPVTATPSRLARSGRAARVPSSDLCRRAEGLASEVTTGRFRATSRRWLERVIRS